MRLCNFPVVCIIGLLLPAARAYADDAGNGPPATFVLAGTVLTPSGPVHPGFVRIERGRIAEISRVPPRRSDAIVVSAGGVIVPGFVDLHNHVSWNVFPRWNPTGQFTNKYQWRSDADYVQRVQAPDQRLISSHFCEMNQWGELRALVGGTTSIASTAAAACIHGLVRNLDYNSGFYGTTELNLERVLNVLELPPAAVPAERGAFAAQARFLVASPAFDALMLHVAEGTDTVAHEEFAFLRNQALLTTKGVVIHGTALGSADFAAMAAAGTALVWSPRSNVELYGDTTDIGAAVASGVEVALAPDWGITGSSNMLDELRYAAEWNADCLGGILSDRQLVEMATAVPARIAGIDDEVGAVAAGLRADLVVLDGGDGRDPYRAVVKARTADVRLVVVGGVPLFGDRQLMRRLYAAAALEAVDLDPRTVKQFAAPQAGVVVADLAAELESVLQAEGTTLAPLAEPEPWGQCPGHDPRKLRTAPLPPSHP